MYKQIVSIEKVRLGTVHCALCEDRIQSSELKGYEVKTEDKEYVACIICGSNLKAMLEGRL